MIPGRSRRETAFPAGLETKGIHIAIVLCEGPTARPQEAWENGAAMSGSGTRPGVGVAVYVIVMVTLGMYFTFASVQGEFGLFRRVQIEAETRALRAERDRLEEEVAALRNKTLRLSDTYLDLELLDQQARDVLGVIRTDEIVLR